MHLQLKMPIGKHELCIPFYTNVEFRRKFSWGNSILESKISIKSIYFYCYFVCYETMSNCSKNCWIDWNSAVLYGYARFLGPLSATILCIWEIWSPRIHVSLFPCWQKRKETKQVPGCARSNPEHKHEQDNTRSPGQARRHCLCVVFFRVLSTMHGCRVGLKD